MSKILDPSQSAATVCPVIPRRFSESPPQKVEAIKYDGKKPDLSLLSPIAMVKVAQVMTFGRQKYGADNWRKGLQWTRYLAASLRHIFAYLGGEDKDPETGISHLAHAVCDLMFLLEFEETHRECDDRYKGESK